MAAPVPILPAHTWASLRCELLWAYETTIHPDSRSMRTVEQIGQRAWLLTRGVATVRRGREEWHAGSGQWLLPPVGSMEQAFSDDAALLSLNFVCRWPDGAELFAGRGGLVLDSAEHPRLERTARALVRTVARACPDAWIHFSRQALPYGDFVRTQSAFFEWLDAWAGACVASGRAYARTESGEERMTEAIRLLNEAPLNAPWPRPALERALGVGLSRVDRLFVRHYGATPRRLHERRRFEQACLRIAETTDPVKVVAFDLGFRHAAHFTQWFERLSGLSPLAYRRRGRPAGPRGGPREGSR